MKQWFRTILPPSSMNKTDSDYCTRLVSAPRPGWMPVLLLAALVFCLASTSLRAQSHPYTGMVVFGDSLSDGGNLNNLISDLVPEQIAQHLTSYDPNYYYNYRFSDGPVW